MISITVMSCDLFNVALISPVVVRSKCTYRSKTDISVQYIYLEGPVFC